MNQDKSELKINTNRDVPLVSEKTNSDTVMKNSCDKKAENLIDWLINTRHALYAVPITMRKINAYAITLAQSILRLPLVLRKRFMYEKLMHG